MSPTPHHTTPHHITPQPQGARRVLSWFSSSFTAHYSYFMVLLIFLEAKVGGFHPPPNSIIPSTTFYRAPYLLILYAYYWKLKTLPWAPSDSLKKKKKKNLNYWKHKAHQWAPQILLTNICNYWPNIWLLYLFLFFTPCIGEWCHIP